MSAPAKTETVVEVPAPGKAEGGGGSMMPILMAVVLVPALCFATTQFVLIPKLKAIVAEQGAAAEGGAPAKASGHGAAAHGAEKAKGGHGGGKEGEHDAEFGSIVVNVAGANGSRYLRTNMVLAGDEPKLPEIIKSNQSVLRDAAINVLSSQSLAVLDSPGGKNVVRSELIAAFNKALGGEVVEQIYFSEFVVQ